MINIGVIIVGMKYSRNILIIIDDRSQFYSSTRELGGSMDIKLIKNNFEK